MILGGRVNGQRHLGRGDPLLDLRSDAIRGRIPPSALLSDERGDDADLVPATEADRGQGPAGMSRRKIR